MFFIFQNIFEQLELKCKKKYLTKFQKVYYVQYVYNYINILILNIIKMKLKAKILKLEKKKFIVENLEINWINLFSIMLIIITLLLVVWAIKILNTNIFK